MAPVDESSAATPATAATPPPTSYPNPEEGKILKKHRYNSHVAQPVLRVIRDGQQCVVKGSVFNFVHKLEGKWSGYLQEFVQHVSPATAEPTNMSRSAARAISTKVTYFSEGYWILRETTAGEDGSASVQFLKLVPIDSGVVSATVLQDASGGHPAEATQATNSGAAANLTLNEMANGAHLVQRHAGTGQLTLFELIGVSDEGHLIRTANTFSPAGDLESISVSRQRRVN